MSGAAWSVTKRRRLDQSVATSRSGAHEISYPVQLSTAGSYWLGRAALFFAPATHLDAARHLPGAHTTISFID